MFSYISLCDLEIQSALHNALNIRNSMKTLKVLIKITETFLKKPEPPRHDWTYWRSQRGMKLEQVPNLFTMPDLCVISVHLGEQHCVRSSIPESVSIIFYVIHKGKQRAMLFQLKDITSLFV